MCNLNQNKGISTPVGILIILVVVLLAGGIIIWQLPRLPREEVKLPEEKAPEEQAKDETAHWQVYRNEELGFEMKYPSDILKFEGFSMGPGETGMSFSGDFSAKGVNEILRFGGKTWDYSAARSGYFLDSQGYEKDEQGNYYFKFLRDEKERLEPKEIIKTDEGVEIVVVGSHFLEGDIPDRPSLEPGDGHLGALINFGRGEFPGMAIWAKIESPMTEELFEQILSTFRFIEETAVDSEAVAVTVTMDIPKTSVSVGEEFEVNYSVETTKSPLYLVTTCRKQGFVKTCQMQEIMHGKIPLKYNQKVCEIADGMANCALDSFISPGTYIFEFEAYECDKIIQKLGIVCDDILRGWASEISKRHDDIVKQVAPIKFLKQEVIVLPKVE